VSSVQEIPSVEYSQPTIVPACPLSCITAFEFAQIEVVAVAKVPPDAGKSAVTAIMVEKVSPHIPVPADVITALNSIGPVMAPVV